MALLLASGAELQGFDGLTGIEGLGNNETTPVVIDTTIAASGAASFKAVCGGSFSGSSGNVWTFTGTALGNTLYVQYKQMFATLATTTCQTAILYIGGSQAVIVNLNSSGAPQLEALPGGTPTNIGSPGTAMVANTFSTFTLAVTVPSSGNSTVALYQDGTLVATSSTVALANTAITEMAIGCFASASAQTVWTDDIVMWDSSGTSFNTLTAAPHAGVVLSKPTADSSTTGFTEGAGGTGSLFDAVNNTPPVGVVLASATNTSQIKDATSNTTDNYVATCQTMTAAGVPSGATLLAAMAVCSKGNSTTTSTTMGISCTANPVITETTGTTGTTAAATWPTGWTTLRTSTANIVYSPTISGAPTVKFRKGTASTNSAMAALVGLLVLYAPGGTSPILPGRVVSQAATRASTY